MLVISSSSAAGQAAGASMTGTVVYKRGINELNSEVVMNAEVEEFSTAEIHYCEGDKLLS